jgi:peptidyl-prolyl cis-trans isomerase C
MAGACLLFGICHGTGVAQPVPAAPPPAAAPPAAAPPAAAARPPDPVVATVNGQPIHLSDVSEMAQQLPEQMRGMSSQQLYPILLDQLVDRQALVIEARKDGLDQTPAVVHQIEQATDTVLQNALLQAKVGPQVTEEAVHARYDRDIEGKPGVEEVQASHILLPTKEAADKVIAELKAGADFAELAKKNSTDSAAAQGGDLGYFKQGDMVPEFSAAAFALQPGQFTQTPVHTSFGWHVIKVTARHRAPPQTYEEAHDALRQQIIQAALKDVIAKARSGLAIQEFNPDGSPRRTVDAAEPPPAQPPAH